MTSTRLGIGEVVRSSAGRDGGRWAVVVAVYDDRNVGIADGRLRSICRPKRKNVRHLERSGVSIEQVARDIEAGLPVSDSSIKQLLATWTPADGDEPATNSKDREVGSSDG